MSTIALADVLLPQRSRMLDAGLVVGASLLTALAAQVAVPLPFTPVPITGQSFPRIATLAPGRVLLPESERKKPSA